MLFLAHAEGGDHWSGVIQPWEIHPALVHFPIAFLIGGVLLDLYAWRRGRADLERVATGMLAVGLIAGAIAALAGVLAFATVPAHTGQAHELMYRHMGIQLAALSLFAWAAWSRRVRVPGPRLSSRVVGWLAAALLTAGGALGGYIVYHGGAGVIPELLVADLRSGHSHGSSGDAPAQDSAQKHHQPNGPRASSDHGKQHAENSSDAAPFPKRTTEARGREPESMPQVPLPDAAAAEVSSGYRVEVVLAGLTYPTSVAFDDSGTMYVAEAGFSYGDDVAVARVFRIGTDGQRETVAQGLNGPITDLLWHEKRLYISHRGKISVLENGTLRDLVSGLPSFGDHHNNQMAIGPDGKLYFGQGTATNSGVVGLDNFKSGWLVKYPDGCDVPAKDMRLTDQAFETPDILSILSDKRAGGERAGQKQPASAEKGDEKSQAKASDNDKLHAHNTASKAGSEPDGHAAVKGHATVKSYAFQPFGKTPPDDGAVRGTIKASGTILRMNLDGSDLELFAWGLRNPFGLVRTPDGKLYATDNGYDERGSRPIAHAPDCLWEIEKGAWYGFPDFAAGVAVTDASFRPKDGPSPKFLLRDHPKVEKPILTLKHHVAAAKMDFSRSADFGFKGQLFVALAGDMNPMTGYHDERTGFEVVRIDLSGAKTESFFKTKANALGPKGMEHVATAGPRRPVGVRFSPDGNSLYVVDFGAMAMISTATGPVPRSFPQTGVIWRVARSK